MKEEKIMVKFNLAINRLGIKFASANPLIIRKTLKTLVIAALVLLTSCAVRAQSSHTGPIPCTKPNYDSTQAIELIYDRYDSAQVPVAKFDKENCEWTVTFFTAHFSKKGDCAESNGCTITYDYKATLNAITGKLKLEKVGMRRTKNWE
jgi:hypothetical protein